MKNLKKQIFKRAIELGFKKIAEIVEYDLPLGLNSKISISPELYFVILQSTVFDDEQNEFDFVKIRKIESVQDFELLFNAICPEKFRLPF